MGSFTLVNLMDLYHFVVERETKLFCSLRGFVIVVNIVMMGDVSVKQAVLDDLVETKNNDWFLKGKKDSLRMREIGDVGL